MGNKIEKDFLDLGHEIIYSKRVKNQKYIFILIFFLFSFILFTFANTSLYSQDKKMTKEEAEKILRSPLVKPIFIGLEKLVLSLNWLATKSGSIMVPGAWQPSIDYDISIIGWEPRDDESYNLFVKRGGLRNITVILPVVTYKGRPIEGVAKYMEESIKITADTFPEAKNIKVKVINTKYGEMMKIYIPELNENYRQFLKSAAPRFNSQYIKEKYTNFSPRCLSEEFGISPIVENIKWNYLKSDRYYGDTYTYKRYVDTHIYTDWEGSGNLYMNINIKIQTSFGLLGGGEIWFIVPKGQDTEKIRTFKEKSQSEKVCVEFKKKGWAKVRLTQEDSTLCQDRREDYE